ncbi:MAG: DUF4097 family beta strand repeat-containing protein [Candidatus Krumholzibacteriales bacterium]
MNFKKDSGKIAGMLKILTLILFILPAASCASYDYEETERMELSAAGIKNLGIIASRCDVKITGGEEIDVILVEVSRRVRAGSEEDARELAEKLLVKVREKDGTIELVTEYPDNEDNTINIFEAIFGGGRNLRMSLDITVPRALNLTFDTSSGDIEVNNIAADVSVSTASGDLKARVIEGKLVARTASGDAEAEDIGSLAVETASGDISAVKVRNGCIISVASGDIDLKDIRGGAVIKAISGDVEMERAGGSLEVNVTSGDVEITDAGGDVKAFTASGDLYVEAAPGEGPREYRLGTSGGNLTLIFSRILSGGFALKAGTTTGNFELDLPIQISGMSRQRVSGIVREGKSRVLIETSSGDITIKEKGV